MKEVKEQYRNLDEYTLEPAQKAELDNLLSVCRKYIHECDELLITRAFKLCYLSHRTETRASGEPYYLHPIEVAIIVAKEIGIDDTSVAAALLHDTVEDTEVTLDLISDIFGDTVALMIDGLTKISDVFKNKPTKQAETFMKLLLHMSQDLRVVLIKFADRLHNMRTIHHLPIKKQIAIATETIDLYAPLAHRFGLFKIKSELEDMFLKTTDPHGYKFISRKIKEKKESREAFVEAFMQPIKEKLEKAGYNFEIKGRSKHIYSIHRKMTRQQKSFDDIYDLFAIRIILQKPHDKEDCWRVYSMITDEYKPIVERLRDFLANPKPNGYQSLHTTVFSKEGKKVEVQIRTHKMDDIAENGVAAHWKYKEGNESKMLDGFMVWVRKALENSGPDEAVDFVRDFQLNLYTNEIYVFTPGGDLKTLPPNATPIDFAFEIHSEVGERAHAAKVNGKVVSLRHKLSSGDQVEIITRDFNLNPDWINDVVTHKARARIRQFIKQEEHQIAELGRELFLRKADKNKIDLSEQELNRIAHKLKYPSIHKLFYDIGNETFPLKKVLTLAKQMQSGFSMEDEGDENKPSGKVTEEEFQKNFIQTARTVSTQGLILNGDHEENIKFSYAGCCNPIPGDRVIGFLSRSGDIKIHRTSCRNINHLIKTEPERVMDVQWPKKADSHFVGSIRIIGEDRFGILNSITDKISKSLATNMRSMNVGSESGMFEGSLIVDVKDIDHLERIIQELKRIEGVKDVYRNK